MNLLRSLSIAGVALATGATTWIVWPRPDASIEVALGGRATVVDHFGRRAPLSDTIFVGGGGARRRVRVINRDTMPHVLALFTVAAGAETDYTVPPGTFGGFCSAHASSKSLTVVVR